MSVAAVHRLAVLFGVHCAACTTCREYVQANPNPEDDEVPEGLCYKGRQIVRAGMNCAALRPEIGVTRGQA